MRELLQAHRDYWKKVVSGKDTRNDNSFSDRYDAVKDRINDIVFSDRNSDYDEKVAHLITDYKDLLTDHKELIDRLKELAKEHFKNKDQSNMPFHREFDNILKATEEKSRRSNLEDKKYKDLVKGRFRITVTRIENEGYEDSIYGKGADFTSHTIAKLIEKGKKIRKACLE